MLNLNTVNNTLDDVRDLYVQTGNKYWLRVLNQTVKTMRD